MLTSIIIDTMQTQDFSSHLTETMTRHPDYKRKVQDLFCCGDSFQLSQSHLSHTIITNPKCFFNLVEPIFLQMLKKQNPQDFFNLKIEIMNFIKYLFQEFSLNAKVIYEQAFLVIEENRKINIVSYILREMAESHQFLSKKEVGEQILMQYIKSCVSVFQIICSVCTLRTSELKFITNNLCQFYYENKLTKTLIGQCFRLLDTGMQERSIYPYLYFLDNKKNDSIRVLFTNNLWPFRKGMTLFLWINQMRSTNCTLFWLKTEDGNQTKIIVEKGYIYVESNNLDHENQKIELCPFQDNKNVVIGVQLEPSEGLFKSTSYQLNININQKTFKDVIKVPKFQNNQFVVQFSLLINFIGTLSSIIITAKPELDSINQLCKIGLYGPCRQDLVWEIIDKKILKTQSILCIFNAQRNFQGLLLNYVYQKNHACFEGRISTVKYHKYDEKIIEIYLPFLYFMSLIEDKDQKWGELFDLILHYLLNIIEKERIEIPSLLYILLFLEYNNYQISQSTLNLIYNTNQENSNFYMNIVVKYMDAHVLIEKGLSIDETVEPFESPIQKTTLMFYLESKWKQTWNLLQGFEGWWSPLFFKSQKDHPYNPKDYYFSGQKQINFEWQVKNFVTKDYCKCFIQPQFLFPIHFKFQKYQQQYLSKECNTQQFSLVLFKEKKNKVLVFQKATTSNFDKLKNKLLKREEESSNKKQKIDFKQGKWNCVYIDILTIIDGVVRLTKDGILVFSAKHNTNRYDRMCVKSFKNQYFQYMVITLSQIRKIYKKRFNATNNAIFIKIKDGRQFLLHFYYKNVDSLLNIISNHVKVKKDAFNNYLNAHKPVQWIDKSISNYEYLQWLNQISGRSYIDITQYPVLPWSYISDSPTINFDNVHEFRNLTKNMGQQEDNDRIKYFLQKYNSQNDEELFNQYHFGTHYSSAAIIFNFLIRIRPYSIGALTLQSGKFDCADRIFYSFYGSWNNAITSPTDIRQLIPQIYTLPEMFINQNNYKYGLTQDKINVDNVILPLWAHQNPYLFVAQQRKALQSNYVSTYLNQWIDLIYGFKQRGKDAIQSMNIFYPLTYQNCIDLDKVTEEADIQSFETQIAHFGQNPSQIIGNNPHPQKINSLAKWQGKLVADGKQLAIRKCFLSKIQHAEQKFIFQSVFQPKNSILGIKFIGQDFFFVLRKHQYYLFQILSEKSNFLSKEEEVNFELQSIRVSLNYKELTTFAPIVQINRQIVIIGGFYNGYTQIVFLKEHKFNKYFKFPCSTITSLAYHSGYHHLFTGDSDGYLNAYKVIVSSRQVNFEHLKKIKAHDHKINQMNLNYNANLISLCSQDGSLSLYNAYSCEIVRTIRHPTGAPIHLVHISTSPLYSVIFYSKQNSSLYVYSINGQLLDSITEKTGFIYNMKVLRSTDSTQSLVYLNAQRQLFVWELPFLHLKRKVKVKRDDSRISCFQVSDDSKIALTGTEEGGLQIIANSEAL